MLGATAAAAHFLLVPDPQAIPLTFDIWHFGRCYITCYNTLGNIMYHVINSALCNVQVEYIKYKIKYTMLLYTDIKQVTI